MPRPGPHLWNSPSHGPEYEEVLWPRHLPVLLAAARHLLSLMPCVRLGGVPLSSDPDSPLR